ncbi:MAG: type II CAAX prenyl endopeptidase Rce1 family protein [Gemmatimonadales bacterium]
MFRERVRAVAGAVVAVIGFYVAITLLSVPFLVIMPRTWIEGSWGFAWAALPVIVAALAANLFLIRRGWSRPETLGWRPLGVGVVWLAAGTFVGLMMAVVALALALGSGGAALEASGEPLGAYLGVALRVSVVLLVAALAEELVFRGYPLARLSMVLGRVGASLLLAGAFAVGHLWNPGVTALGVLNIGLAGLVLSAAFFTRGGLLAAWGVHFGWNGGLSLGADAPVSGIEFEIPALDFAPGETTWLAGGSFGPEGGLAATVAMGVALFFLVRRARAVEEGGVT